MHKEVTKKLERSYKEVAKKLQRRYKEVTKKLHSLYLLLRFFTPQMQHYNMWNGFKYFLQ